MIKVDTSEFEPNFGTNLQIVIILQTEKEKSRLHCYYETKSHPYLAICPNKIELLNEFPAVIQIYDILGPRAIEAVIKKSTPSLTRSSVINRNDPKVVVSSCQTRKFLIFVLLRMGHRSAS